MVSVTSAQQRFEQRLVDIDAAVARARLDSAVFIERAAMMIASWVDGLVGEVQ